MRNIKMIVLILSISIGVIVVWNIPREDSTTLQEILGVTVTSVSRTTEPVVLASGDLFAGLTLIDMWESYNPDNKALYQAATFEGYLRLTGTLQSTGAMQSYVFIVDERHWHLIPSFDTDKPSPYALYIFDFPIAASRPDGGALVREDSWTVGAMCGQRGIFLASHILIFSDADTTDVLIGAFDFWL